MSMKPAMPPVLTGEDFTETEIADAQALGAEASTAVQQLLEQLRDLMSGVDQIELLSRLALRTILGLHTFGTENHNPQLHAHELEFLQAVALSRPRSRNAGAFAMTPPMERILPLARHEDRRVGTKCL